ncbi:hypothetical protein KSP39_PZI011804 [Platanthera zijinensis]|uniref:C2H2-type domain-containing protein n=1 Tax=Platanthera zijinensis TaxID=2320716 RepID=A0AAP0BFZ2_9ASPA
MKNHAFTRHQPEADHPLFSSVLNRKNNPAAGILGDLVRHDWEAVRYFLSSQVRPGGDVSRIYKCSVCRHEFPNAQAYGGHMSSHSKSNKKSPPMKKTKRPKKGIKRLKTMDMDSVKGRIVIEEALNVEIEQGNAAVDEDDEDWFKFLNYDAV